MWIKRNKAKAVAIATARIISSMDDSLRIGSPLEPLHKN